MDVSFANRAGKSYILLTVGSPNGSRSLVRYGARIVTANVRREIQRVQVRYGARRKESPMRSIHSGALFCGAYYTPLHHKIRIYDAGKYTKLAVVLSQDIAPYTATCDVVNVICDCRGVFFLYREDVSCLPISRKSRTFFPPTVRRKASALRCAAAHVL